MGALTILAGETTTINAGETVEAGPINLDGTLNIDGTLNVDDIQFTASASAGATITGVTGKDKDIVGLAEAGVDAIDPLLPGAKDVFVSAQAGADSTVTASKAKPVLSSANAGADATPVIDSFVPLRRRTTSKIDNTRTDDFSTQANGETE